MELETVQIRSRFHRGKDRGRGGGGEIEAHNPCGDRGFGRWKVEFHRGRCLRCCAAR
uniref:Uncharacterized protein n=1 Tax=Fagus sylvatica TaxID=28930 RepID=A0A2N9ICK4_FAGSY